MEHRQSIVDSSIENGHFASFFTCLPEATALQWADVTFGAPAFFAAVWRIGAAFFGTTSN